MEQIASTTNVGKFYVASSRMAHTVNLITTSATFQLEPLEALELASALIAHAERAEQKNVSLAPTQRELGRAAKSRSVPFFCRGGVLVDAVLVVLMAFAMPVLLHYGFELIGM